MNPLAMSLLLGGAMMLFAYSANRRWQLLKVGAPDDSRFEHLPERLASAPDLPPSPFGYAIIIGAAFFLFIAVFLGLMGIGHGPAIGPVRTAAAIFGGFGGGLALFWALRAQVKMPKYPTAGIAHYFIFTGFAVLLLRTIILVGRGYDPHFNALLLDPAAPGLLGLFGKGYNVLKDVVVLLVLAGVFTFVRFRLVTREKRLAYGWHAWVVLGVIATMMLADLLYDGAHTLSTALKAAGGDAARAGDLVGAMALANGDLVGGGLAKTFHAIGMTSTGTLDVVAGVGFWTHVFLVLAFLNYLPYGKHFHVITALPNVLFRRWDASGRLSPMAKSADELVEKMTAAMEQPDPGAVAVGVARIEHFTWKSLLDLYTCTECGRCSDNCPAHRTGKLLSPKHLTIDLRDHLYGRANEFINRPEGPRGAASGADGHAHDAHAHEGDEGHDDGHGHGDGHGHEALPENPIAIPPVESRPVNLVPEVIHPDVLWACTTCRACEEQCPVMITYVDKIVDMRRNLVMVRGEFPAELQKTFTALETNGNPWNLTKMDRGAWSDGLDVATMADKPDAAVLYWVGCAASYDDRAKKIARATARLFKHAGVDFAILGSEETCTGDPARRAGNEHLYMMLAQENVQTLNNYGVKKIVTACPHCFNTLLNEYPDLGGRYEVVHHTDFLLGLMAEGKLKPKRGVDAKIVYHDSCYLGRYNSVYEAPREVLKRIPGVELVEAEWNREKGLCCGAGGAQMWMEERHGHERVNKRRTLQLVDSGANMVATGCPFCQTMISDGLKEIEDTVDRKVAQLDVAEVLARSLGLDDAAAAPPPTPAEPEKAAATAEA